MKWRPAAGFTMMVSMTWPDLDTIATARCQLESLSPAHGEPMVDILAEPELYEFIGGTPPTLAQLRWRYQAQSVGHSADQNQWWCNWIVIRLDHAYPAGYVQSTVERSSGVLGANIAWAIQPKDQGIGLTTEAAAGMIEWLSRRGVVHYTAYIQPEHAASSHVASKLGLHRTAVSYDGELRWETTR